MRRILSQAVQRRFRAFRKRGYPPKQAMQQAKRLTVIQNQKRKQGYTSEEAFRLANDRLLLAEMNRFVRDALGTNRSAIKKWTKDKQRFVLCGFLSEADAAYGNVLAYPRRERERILRQVFRHFAARYARLSQAAQNDPVKVQREASLSFGESTNFPPPTPGWEELDRSIAQSLLRVAHEHNVLPVTSPRGRRASENAIDRAFREGTQKRLSTQQQIVRLAIRELTNPHEVRSRFNMNRAGIPKTIEAFLRQTYPDFDRKPEAARERLRQEFEGNLLATFALKILQDKARIYYERDLQTLEEQARIRQEDIQRLRQRFRNEEADKLKLSHAQEKRLREKAGLLLNLLHRPEIIRFALKELPIFFSRTPSFTIK